MLLIVLAVVVIVFLKNLKRKLLDKEDYFLPLRTKVSVRRMYRHATREIVEKTKGSYGDCLVPLIPAARELIAAAQQKQIANGKPSDGYIFSMNEKPTPYTAVTKAFYSFCKKAGIDEKSSHKARKTFISSLLDNGVNLNTVRQYVGHTDERTTLNNYYFDRSTSEENLAKMQKALK